MRARSVIGMRPLCLMSRVSARTAGNQRKSRKKPSGGRFFSALATIAARKPSCRARLR